MIQRKCLIKNTADRPCDALDVKHILLVGIPVEPAKQNHADNDGRYDYGNGDREENNQSEFRGNGLLFHTFL
jgi:hypothetical protein